MRKDILVGCDYDQLNMHTPVLNLSALGGFLWMQIPVGFCKYQLFEIYDISDKVSREVAFYGKIHQDHDHPWLQIPTEILDLKSGKHTYRFDFLDVISNVYNTIFISYVIQDDNPLTSYVYMENRGNTSEEDNSWKDGQYADDFYENLRESVEETYGYDPLLFAESEGAYSDSSNSDSYNYCSTCTLPSCENCPYKEA